MGKAHLPLLPLVILTLASLSFIIAAIARPTSVLSVSETVLISEIQIEGSGANDEFVELYNSSDLPVDLTGWRLAKKTATSTAEPQNLAASLSGTIQPHSYFLIAHPGYTNATVSADLFYSATSSGIAANNTVLLFRDAGITIVDKVGMGTAFDNETQATVVPDNDESIERKANESSTADSMGPGGANETDGNGRDSDNNNNDFILRKSSDPQNSSSSVEPEIPEPTSTNTPTPTLTETPTPTPTEEPTPTETQTPTPTVMTTPTDSPTPTPTESPTPTLTPAPSTTPTPASPTLVFRNVLFTCRIVYSPLRVMGLRFLFPSISCGK